MDHAHISNKSNENFFRPHVPSKQPDQTGHNLHEPICNLQQTAGNQAVRALLGSKPVQAKLSIGTPGDIYEQEADRIAELVSSISEETDCKTEEPEEDELSGTGGLSSQTHFRHIDKKNEEPLQASTSGNEPVIPLQGLSNVLQKELGGGTPLAPEIQRNMERHFDTSFDNVRIHNNSEADRLNRSLNARAFTHGNDVYFRENTYSPTSQDGRKLLAHELTHVLQQRDSKIQVQCDNVSDARELLSYSIGDWAITDSDTMQALAHLARIPQADLAAELARLGSLYINRLLDNLPDSAKTGDDYQRIIQAVGAGGSQEYAQDLLSYGAFDWAITDSDVGQVFNIFNNFSPADQENFLENLNNTDPNRLARLVSNSNAGHHTLYFQPWIRGLSNGNLSARVRAILRTIVENSNDDALDTMLLSAEKRFNVTVGRAAARPGKTPIDWRPDSLRQTYLTLDLLPAAHVEGNSKLLRLGQFDQPSNNGMLTAGQYRHAERELAINAQSSDVQETAIHETGHAVDREMGWSTGAEPARSQRGGWHVYGANYTSCATDMVADSSAAIQGLSVAERSDVITCMRDAMANRSVIGLHAAIRALPWFAVKTETDKERILGDPSLQALDVGLKRPWFSASNGGVHLGNHVYQEGYENDWVRYEHAARGWRVSDYQFRDPGEWFAEAYAYYYLPDPRGRGAKLDEKDHDTKVYFDNHVHTLASSR